MTGMGPGLMILALVCSTANRLNSSTVAPPLRLSNTTTIPKYNEKYNEKYIEKYDICVEKYIKSCRCQLVL